MYEYHTIIDCMIFTSYDELPTTFTSYDKVPKTIALDVNVGSEELLDVNELAVFASRECKIECSRRNLGFYGFRIMRIHRFKLDKAELTYKPL